MSTPPVSVVIASAAGEGFVFRCLESLRDQSRGVGAEVIVADRCGGETRARLERDWPSIRVVRADAPERPSVPELRRRGVEQARADTVAIIEEHCVAPPQWLEAIRDGLREGDAAVGGPILDDDYPRIRDWVVYFSEYHNFLPPWPDGAVRPLNGANIAYRRSGLVKHRDVLGSGYWEVVLHPRLAEEGLVLRSVPRMGVRHTGPFGFRYYLTQRYLLSRVWGGTQRDRAPVAKRLVYLAAAPLFPLLLLGRIAHRVLRSRRRVARLLIAFPLLVPVAIAYVWGEWLGYLLGPGDALSRVE